MKIEKSSKEKSKSESRAVSKIGNSLGSEERKWSFGENEGRDLKFLRRGVEERKRRERVEKRSWERERQKYWEIQKQGGRG